MTSRKQPKNVAGMAVLKDIRGLLSGSTVTPQPAAVSSEDGFAQERTKYEEKLKKYEIQLHSQDEALGRLESEKADLLKRIQKLEETARLEKNPAALPGTTLEAADLAARKAELDQALESTETLLQMKLKDLTRRIARVYQEAGDMDAVRDFRRVSSQLEASENFGAFIRSLLNE